MKNQYLHQPLLPSTTVSATSTAGNHHAGDSNHRTIAISSTRGIIFRLLSVLLIGLLSIWANHEASKGFNITIINEAKDTPAGRRFSLLFVSNDKATRVLLNANLFVENILCPRDNEHTFINHVILRLTNQYLTKLVAVSSGDNHEFVIHISSSVMEERDVSLAMARVVTRAMARIWLWNGRNAPPNLIDGMIEYITMLSGFSPGGGLKLPPGYSSQKWWEDKDARKVANFLQYCEGQEKGFIQRLNQAMRGRLEEWTVDDEDHKGFEGVEHLCSSCNATDQSLSNYW